MMIIPRQLQVKEFRFIKIKSKTKIPFEPRWQSENNYAFDDNDFQQWVSNENNYGVVGGYGKLCIIDADDPEVEKAIVENLPETFTVKSRRGKHFYFIVKDLTKPIRLIKDKAGDIGDVKYTGGQVIGSGSIHPSGTKYEIFLNKEIAEIHAEQIRYALHPFMKTEVEESVLDESDVFKKTIDIAGMINLKALHPRGNGEYQGRHPIHGSDSGLNFSVNPEKGVWYCFRHGVGGGAFGLLAVLEKLTDCGRITKGTVRNKFREIIKIANKKYGFEITNEIKASTLNFFDERGRFIPRNLSSYLMETNHFKTTKDNEDVFVYDNGVYKPEGSPFIKKKVEELLVGECKVNYVNEAFASIQRRNYDDIENLPLDVINVCNGLLNMITNELQPHDPSVFTTTQINAFYKPEVDCPMFKNFLTEILEPEDIVIIQEMFGYCLYRDYPIQKAFMFVGQGANGKSTLLNVLTSFIGIDNISNISLQALASDRFAGGNIYGKMVNIYDDLSSTALTETGLFKIITGGGVITADRKFKKAFNFKNYAKLIFSANQIPISKDSSDAFFRRWMLLNFPKMFTADQMDEKLISKLTTEEELSGILNWSLIGLKRLLERGKFTNTLSIDQIQEQYDCLSNPVYGFVTKCCDTGTENYAVKEELFANFIQYCKTNKLPKLSQTSFTKKLKMEASIITERVTIDSLRKMCFRGISIKKDTKLVQNDKEMNLFNF